MKNYINKDTKAFIENSIFQLEIDENFKPYIVDILMRRAYQFDFTKEEIRTDLTSLSHSLKSIKVTPLMVKYAGLYKPMEKSITINLSGNLKYLYEILTHELFHACTHNEDGTDRLGSYNYISKNYNCCLIEALVERAAYKTIYNTGPENPYYNLNALAYGGVVSAVDMISAAFGVKEQEVLKNGIQDRSKLINFLSEKTGQDVFHIKGFFDKLEMNYAIIHNSLYGNKKEKGKILNRGKNVSLALGEISKLCARQINFRFEDIPLEELSSDNFENIKFDYNKLNVTINKMCRNFSLNPTLIGFSKKIVKETSDEDILCLKNGIIQTEYIRKFDTNTFPEEIKKFLPWVRWGNLNKCGSEILNKAGIDLPEKDNSRDNFNISQKTIERNSDSKEKTDSWDNSIIKYKFKLTLIKNILKRQVSKTKSIFSEKKLELPEPLEEHTKKYFEDTPSWILKQDEAKKVNEFNRHLNDISEKENIESENSKNDEYER